MTVQEHRTPPRMLAVALLALAVFVALFLMRGADDNRLTSWAWVFQAVDARVVYAGVAVALLVAYPPSRLPLPPAWALSGACFIMSALFFAVPEQIVDSSRYFTQAKHLELYGAGYFISQWGEGLPAWTDMPLVPFLYGLIFRYASESRLLVQCFNASLFSLTAALAVMIGRDLWDEAAGRAAGALMLAMPYLYSQVPLMLVDVHSMFFLTLAVFAFNRFMGSGGSAMAALSVAAAVACIFTKYSLWLLLSVLAVVFLVRLREGGRTVLIRALSAMALAGAVAGAGLTYKHGVVADQMRLLVEYQKPALGRWSESFLSTFFFQLHPFIALAAMFSIYQAIRERDYRYVIVAWLPCLMIFMGVRRIRYLLPVFPMLALMAAYGASRIRDERAGRFVVSAAVAVSVAISLLAYRPFLMSQSGINLKEAGAYIDELAGQGRVRVITLPQRSMVNPAVAVPLLDYYTEAELTYDYGEFQRRWGRPKKEDIEGSPLRFTWQYENPSYYEPSVEGDKERAVVVISGGRPSAGALGEIGPLRMLKAFDRADGPFRFRTAATVYARQ